MYPAQLSSWKMFRSLKSVDGVGITLVGVVSEAVEGVGGSII